MRTKELTTLSGNRVDVPIVDEMYIGGEFVGADETFPTSHPATGEHLADVPIASPDQVDEAVQAAHAASLEWREVSPTDRRRRVEAFAAVIEDAAFDITTVDVADNGSSISKMKNDAERGAKMVRYFAGLVTELKGETIPTDDDTLDYTVREPYGVVAGIVPFNHPAAFVVRKIAPAVVAGNGIVLKPSEYTSLSALYIAKLIDDNDLFPPGLVNVVTGAGEVGAALTTHDDVGLVTMIGSAATGKKVMKAAADHLAPVILELGGKNPNIVFPDADLDEAAEGAVSGMSLKWQGQSCGSGTRLFVHDDVYDEMVDRVVAGFEEIRPGDPFDEETDMGAIVSGPQFEKVTSYIDSAKAEGATLLTGGKVVEHGEGYFVEPTIFEVEPDMTIACEEIFGPVLSVFRWDDYDQMMAIVNDIDYGLTGSVWTSDLETAHRAVEDIESGYLWVNQHGGHHIGAPFGGYKESGIGKNESLDELLDHTRVKNVNISL